MQTYSLSEESFGYNYGHLKSSVSHLVVSWTWKGRHSVYVGCLTPELRKVDVCSDVYSVRVNNNECVISCMLYPAVECALTYWFVDAVWPCY